MKVTGSTGKFSRTMLFNMIMIAIDFVFVNIQLLENILSPTAFAVVFLVLGLAQKLGNMYFRTITTTPLK